MQEGEISRPAEHEEKAAKLNITKRDKIIIGVIVGLIVAVFALIIVNSAIISNLNTEISVLEGMAESARTAFENVSAQLSEATSYGNVYRFALENGLITGCRPSAHMRKQ